MHRLTRHVEPSRHLHDRFPIVDHQTHGLIPLLHNTQLHQHERSVKDQAKPNRQASGGTTQKMGAASGI